MKKYLSESLTILFEVRAKRPRPHLDDKIVTAWNGKREHFLPPFCDKYLTISCFYAGLIISGLAQAGTATRNKTYIDYAENAAKFVERYLFDAKKRILLRSCYRGQDNAVTQP